MGDFWNTMNVLVGREWRKIEEDLEEWVENIVRKDNNKDEEKLSILKIGHIPSFCSSILTVELKDEDVKEFFKKLNLPKVECIFTHPENQSHLEELMGSNYVSLVDRDYMQKLQERILQDYANKMNERIKTREGEELERVKHLVLDGKIPISMAPEEMSSHPIMFLEAYMHQNDAKRRKIAGTRSPSTCRSEKVKTPSSRLTREEGVKIIVEFSRDSTVSNEDVLEPIVSSNEYDKCKNDNPLMKQLRNSETVEEMYTLADEIIGFIKEVETTTKSAEEALSSL